MLPANFWWLYLPWGLFVIIMVVYIIDSLRNKSTTSAEHVKSDEKNIRRLQERDKAFRVTAELNDIILDTLDFNTVIQRIADAIPHLLGYQTGVLALVDETDQTLKRVAISATIGGDAATRSLEVPFSTISISLKDEDNYCIKALKQNKFLYTTRLYDVLLPAISEENADKVQKEMGTQTTLIFPIFSKDKKPYGTFLVSMSKEYSQITEYEHETLRNYIDGIRIALNNAKLYSSLEITSKQLEVANNQLKELDKLKDEFVSVASHELRTPMTAIKSYLWMALQGKGGELNDKQKYYIERGYNSVERLIRLVNDMLNISRIESGRITINMMTIDLQKFVQEIVDEVKPRSVEMGVNVAFAKSANPLYAQADPDKIREVFINLIGNSLKFTPKGGIVAITLKDTGEFIEVAVKDTGTGIEPEDLNKLFQKFGLLAGSYVTNQKAMGTGLGLYISKSIVELHNGKIWAASEGRGKGSTFTFTLKKSTQEEIANINANKPEGAAQANKVDLVRTEI